MNTLANGFANGRRRWQMGFLKKLFGSKKTKPDPSFLDLESTVRRLAQEHVEAAASGRPIKNRLPEFVRTNRLKLRVLELLEQDPNVPANLRSEIDSLDFEGPLGPLGTAFDSIRARLPQSALIRAEELVRVNDDRGDYADLPKLSE